MKKLQFLLAFALVATALTAQQPVKKYVLIEHFTNSRCSVCASRNPAFFTLIEQPQNASELHHLAVHPQFPYSNCVFYQANTADNTALVSRYNVLGTPSVVLNGTLNPSGSTLLSQATLNTYLNQTSPLHVKVTENNTGGTARTVSISARTVGSIPTAQYKLFVVLAEKTINLTTPNGEKVHHNVMRDLISSDNFTPAALGGTVDLTYTYTPNAAWNASELYILAFVQNTATKEIINSGTRFDPAISGTQEAAPQQVSIQPNPAQDLAYAQVSDDEVKQVELFSVSGQRTVLSFQAQQGQIELPVAALTPGVYFVKMTGEKGVYVGKMVKQ